MPTQSSTTARVVADFGADYLIDDGASTRRVAARRCDPAVGDWVMVEGGFITDVHPRNTVFSRKVAGVETREQVLAANVDVAFVVAAATDVNPRRIERYLTIAWQSGANPVVVVTKADLVDSVERIPVSAPSIITSSISGVGMDEVARGLQPSKTGLLLGPSGVGKSTLLNALLGREAMTTREAHRSGEGRHMTSHRQLFPIPTGGMIVDVPGLREAQLWQGEEALGGVFEDIEQLALRCRFADCAHDTEPGCAIKAALAAGSLDPGRFQSYRKLRREPRAVAAKTDVRIRNEERKKWKQVAMANKKARW